MEPELRPAGADDERRYTARHIRRALARHFPRLHWLYNWLRVQGVHYAKRTLGAFRPRRAVATIRWLVSTWRRFAARRSEPRLTVGIEIAALWEPLTGVGWYLYKLLEAVADRPDLRLRLYGPTVVDSPDRVDPRVPLPTGQALEWVLHDVPDGLALPRGLVIRLLRRLEPLLIAADGNEVLFAPNYFLPRRFRLAAGARVITVHDLGFRTVPWTLQEETLRELTGKLEHSIFEASRIITVSRAIKDELAAYGYAEPDRVHAVHHGPGHMSDLEPGAPPNGLPARYALHVGTLEPRKNVSMLLAAWRLVRQRLPEAPDLVFCGRFGWKAESIRTAVAAGEREGWVRHLGYVSEAELAALYRGAELVVFPSLYEGFGLPAVEAFLAGTPLVCSDIAALREVAAEAALYAPADRPDLFAERVVEILTSAETREHLARAGALRASTLSWARAGGRTIEVWRHAAGRAVAEAAA